MAALNSDPRSSTAPVQAMLLHPHGVEASEWFCQRVREELEDNLAAIVVYGPAVTRVFDFRRHFIHHLLVIKERQLEPLLRLGESSKRAARFRIAPPLIITAQALERSYDVFPLEWLDISLFHRTVFGKAAIQANRCHAAAIRLQCERELRSLDLQLQRGILACDGKESRIGRLEDEASDALIRTLRGIVWLSGDRAAYLPDDVCRRCETVVRHALEGCRQSICHDGRHDRRTMGLLLHDLSILLEWIDAHP
jgi:hypothetical protein